MATTPPAPADPETLGAVAVALAWDWASWVNRRVETIEFVEDTTIRRAVSIDFTLPPPADLAATIAPDDWIVVPLQIVAKGPLMHVDVFDEQRASLSTLNTVRNTDLATRGVVRLLNAIAAQAGRPPLTPATMDAIAELVQAPVARATTIRDALLTLGEELAEVLAIGTPAQRSERQLVDELTTGFLQLVQLPYEPGRHRVVKVAYDVAQPWDETGPEIRFGPTLRGLGALPRRRTFELNIGQGLGHHVEVIAPEDTEIVAARLRGTQWSSQAGARQPLFVRVRGRSRSRAHAYVRLVAGEEGAPDPGVLRELRSLGRGDQAEFRVALAPRRAGVVAVATATAVFTAVTMIVFAMRLARLDGQTSAAVLLLVPAIFAAYISRPGEHPFATRALIGVRAWALAGAGLAAILSVMIGAGFTKAEAPRAASVTPSVQDLRCRSVRGTARRPLRGRTNCTLRARATPAREVGETAAVVAAVLAGLSVVVALIMVLGYVVARRVRRAADA
jgi:hypothetical protein